MLLSSLHGVPIERVSNGQYVRRNGFAQDGCRVDSSDQLARNRDHASGHHRSVTWRASALAGDLVVVLAILLLPGPASADPSAATPTRVAGNEVSITQVSPGAIRSTRRRPVVVSPRAHIETNGALKKMAEDAATAHTLPVGYFLRLIRQESGFDPNSVSRAGAQGIAQFMPGTASERGLTDPFDPAEALPKSAELLNELKQHFGNLGLAAAAYNAGPERIHRWLAGKSALPLETINYVRAITGHDAADWARSNDLALNLDANGIGSSSILRLRVNRLSWEAQLLATLRAASATQSDTTTTKASLPRKGEAALCAHCILRTSY